MMEEEEEGGGRMAATVYPNVYVFIRACFRDFTVPESHEYPLYIIF
jgi:hypothetical protein